MATRATRWVVDVLEQDDELVAAEARRGVGGAHAPDQPPRGLAQELVAGRVAEAVVDVLERVEVDEQDRGARDSVRAARASACSSRSISSWRFGSPVSESWKAWWIASSTVFASLSARLACSAKATSISRSAFE